MGRSRGPEECIAVSEEVTEVVKSSRSRAKFSTPLDRDLRLFGLLEGGCVLGRRYPFWEFESSAKIKNYSININIRFTVLLFCKIHFYLI